MQETTHKGRNLIISLVILAAVLVAGYYYSNRDRSTDDLLTSVPAGETTGAVEGDLLSSLQELRKLKLDDSIFSGSVWASFADFGQTIPPQQAGRPNPFAPLGSSTQSIPPVTF
jgi:hypothetical protein